MFKIWFTTIDCCMTSNYNLGLIITVRCFWVLYVVVFVLLLIVRLLK